MPTKVHIIKGMIFPVVMYGCESWTIKKAEHQRVDALELQCWRGCSRVPWTARRSNQSILKEINPEYSLEPEIKLSTSAGSSKKQESSRKTSISVLLTTPVDHNKLWKILKEMGIPDHLICLLRNLYAGQEATVRTGHGTTDLFQIGKGICQGCILSPCLFNFYAEYIMRNAGLDEAQAGIKIAGRNINNLRYADDTTLMAESKRN